MDRPLLRRLWTYQAERYPLVAYAPLMAVGAFAAAAVSAASRDAGRFPWLAWVVGVVTLLVYFLFLRVLDEHKDAADDARHRPELAVPRGLVTLAELRRVAVAAVAVAIALNALIDTGLLVLLALALAWAGLMGREFFVRDWLRARPTAYLLSHMVAMPLIFFYATGLDWVVAETNPPPGTGAFLVLSFLNGIVIEVGRKIRAPGAERPGVDTYSSAWGLGRALAVWIGAVAGAGGAATAAAAAAGDATVAPILLAIAGVVALVVAGLLAASATQARARWIEPASAVWVLAAYAGTGVGAFLHIAG
jgi:hypothetical protein